MCIRVFETTARPQTAGQSGPDAAVGAPIGIGFYGRGDAAFDDVTFEIIPEPSATLLLGFTAAGGLLMRRRRQ